MERATLLLRLDAESQIRQLTVRYALAIDSRDLDTLVGLFVEDVNVATDARDAIARRTFPPRRRAIPSRQRWQVDPQGRRTSSERHTPVGLMTVAQTVLGPVAAADLGFTLTHEHLFIGWPGWSYDPVAGDHKVEQRELRLRKLRDAYSRGVRKIVDASPAELGRDVDLLAEMSETTGINVTFRTYPGGPREPVNALARPARHPRRAADLAMSSSREFTAVHDDILPGLAAVG